MASRLAQRLAGWSLIGGAALFWLSWYLMPQPGSTDPAFILAAVAAQRGNVLASAVVQTLAAVAFVPPALAIVRLWNSRLLQTGAALLLVGAIGNGADAVYHQLAYEMTAPSVAALLGLAGRLGLWRARPASLAVLGLVSVALGWVGWALRRAPAGG